MTTGKYSFKIAASSGGFKSEPVLVGEATVEEAIPVKFLFSPTTIKVFQGEKKRFNLPVTNYQVSGIEVQVVI
jgi:uncharacterized membrane protein